MTGIPTGWRRYAGFGIGRSNWLLVAAQTCYFMGTTIDMTLTAIVGLSLAPTPALATVPLASITVVGMFASIAAGLLAGRFGYVRVMIGCALMAVFGAGVSVFAVTTESFLLLCCGTALAGAYRPIGGYIRYMAADRAPAGQRERVLSFVLYGGLVAAFIGPFMATTSAGFFAVRYTGAYMMVGVYAVLIILLLLALRATDVGRRSRSRSRRRCRSPRSGASASSASACSYSPAQAE